MIIYGSLDKAPALLKVLAILMLLSIGACKKKHLDPIKKQFPQDFFVKTEETILYGTLKDSSSYELKSLHYIPIFLPNSDYKGYSFADLLRLDSKSIFCISSRFRVLDDNGYADFVSKASHNNGETWTIDSDFKVKMGGINVMSPNLLRIDKEKVMFVYLVKVNKNSTDIYMQLSSDNAISFGEARKISTVQGYQVINNARIIRLRNGRIVLPISILGGDDLFKIFCYYSDDLGETWKTSSILSSNASLMEPSVTELPNGDLFMVIRTREGVLYFSKSTNKGETWEDLYHSELISPESPATMISFKGKVLLFWNQTRYEPNQYRNRTPLNVAISEDEGRNWSMVGILESNSRYQYSYISATLDEDDIYLTYYKMGREDDKAQLIFSKIKIIEK